MTAIVQQTYRPQMAPAVVGMIADETDAEISTFQCETAAGLPFGVAVSQGAGDYGCVLGGSKFIGVTVKDVTLIPGVPMSPNVDTVFGVDLYPQYSNVGVMTRGRIWVIAGADVAAGDAGFYNTTNGGFSNSASGQAGSGNVTFTQQPAAGSTLTLNGTVITFGTDVAIGPTLGSTIQNLANFINASADTQLVKFRAAAFPPSPGGAGEGSGANTLLLAAVTVGTGGNALTVATNVAGATLSGATLAGGTAAATAITSSKWRTSALAGQLAILALALQQ